MESGYSAKDDDVDNDDVDGDDNDDDSVSTC